VTGQVIISTGSSRAMPQTRAAELDMEIMRAREANGPPVISPMLGLRPEKWECEFRDYLVALGDPRVADPEWLAARIREEQRRARSFVKWFDAWFEGSANWFDFGKEELRRPVGQPQHSRRTPEERQEAMNAAHAGCAAFADGIAESSCPHTFAPARSLLRTSLSGRRTKGRNPARSKLLRQRTRRWLCWRRIRTARLGIFSSPTMELMSTLSTRR
jgi:hypothetical protein